MLPSWILPHFMILVALSLTVPLPGRDPSKTYSNVGRPRCEIAQVLRAIYYILRTGIPWKALDRNTFGVSGSTAHRYHMEWCKPLGFYWQWFMESIRLYCVMEGIDFTGLVIDACIIASPLGLESVGPNPKDCGKNGSKRTILCDACGAVLSMVLCGANSHDVTQLLAALEAMGVELPEELRGKLYLYADKGYVGKEHEETIREHGLVPNIPKKGGSRGTRKAWDQENVRKVVEHCHSWFNRFRKLKPRYEKYHNSYFGLMCIAAVHINLRKIDGGIHIYGVRRRTARAA